VPETTPTTAANETLNALSQQLVAVTTERDSIKSERDTFRRLYLEMLGQNRKLELGLLRGRERDLGDPNQVTLSMLAMMTGGGAAAPVAEPEKTEPVRGHERAKPTGRKPLPEKLPRIDVTVIPPEVQARGTDAFEQIGEDVTETVERRPSGFIVVRVHKPKYVEIDRDLKHEVHVFQAPPPELPIERGLAGPAMLADTVVRRWADHLPLHRLERIYGRDGLELARSTVCGWHMDLAKLVRPLIAAMWKDALLAPYLCVDATGVLVQAAEKCRNAHFWVLAAPERHVLFGFSAKHNNAAVDALLAGYEGILVADAHAVYDHLFKDGKIREAGCWAHVRRYYFKALGSDPLRARWAIGLIGKLFQIERVLATASPEVRLAARKIDSAAVLAEFEAWCDAESLRVLDETPISKAISYATNHRAALRRFLEDGRVPIHNNWSERELRREAVGRKNWLFVGSDEGGVVNATFVSLIASCQLHGIDPYEYLRDLFCLLPSWNAHRVLELSPLKWRETSARAEVRKALDENIYRRASLGT
jgi:transposase